MSQTVTLGGSQVTIGTPEVAQARAARIAGAMYLITSATAVFGMVFLRSSLLVSGDATATAQNIIRSERLFRIGIASDLATYAGVLVLSWALYVLLRPVNKDLALLAAFFRLVETAIGFVATFGSLLVLVLLSDVGYLKAFQVSQLHSMALLAISTLGAGYNIAFIVLGLGSTVFAYLLLKSRYVPQLLAGWGVFSSLLLAMCALFSIVFPRAAKLLQIVSFPPMGIYEVTLGAWLLLKGVKSKSASANVA